CGEHDEQQNNAHAVSCDMCEVWVCSRYVPPSRNSFKLVVMRMRGLHYVALFGGCVGSANQRGVTSPATTAEASSQQIRPTVTADGTCVSATLVEGGVEKGSICVAAATAKGLAIVDLTDTWTPTLFAPTTALDGTLQTPSFHDRYLALANERDEQ